MKMLKVCLMASALALLLGGAAAAQPMPLPPSVADTPPAAAKPGTKAKAAKKRASPGQNGTRVERSTQSMAAPLRPFDRRDIVDPQADRRLAPQITPGGGLGMGGRF